ncbi:MAG TPA: hypothetical protein VFB45_06180 [Pseudolabrys sp.]|nr:hypothetical protein [Pseudolabrys sp.]
MKFILGMITGAVMLVSGAYVHDTRMMPLSAGDPAPKTFVNWDQFIGAFAR